MPLTDEEKTSRLAEGVMGWTWDTSTRLWMAEENGEICNAEDENWSPLTNESHAGADDRAGVVVGDTDVSQIRQDQAGARQRWQGKHARRVRSYSHRHMPRRPDGPRAGDRGGTVISVAAEQAQVFTVSIRASEVDNFFTVARVHDRASAEEIQQIVWSALDHFSVESEVAIIEVVYQNRMRAVSMNVYEDDVK